MRQILNRTRPLITTFVWGIIGGVILILISLQSHTGMLVILTYAVALIISSLTVQTEDSIRKKFITLFLTVLSTFLLMSFISYAFIIIKINQRMLEEPFSTHFHIFGLMLGIGVSVSFILAFLITMLTQTKRLT